MDWSHPEALYLILPLAAMWLGLALHARARRKRAAEQFVAAPLWPRLLPPPSSERFWLKAGLWGAALVLGLVALAGPRFGTYMEAIRPRGSDLYVLMDVSRSMLAEDVPPNRLARAKADVTELLKHLHGERVGLIAFAGKPVVRCPLTTDYSYFRQSLNELNVNSAPCGGTLIGDAIRKALDVLKPEADRDQSLLLITDGGDQDSKPLLAADLAAEHHVMIFTVGLGDPQHGALIPVEKFGNKRFVEYEGKEVRSKLDGELLGKIAVATNATYVPAGTRDYDLGQLYDERLKALRAGQKEMQRERKSEQYQIFLGFAVAFFLLELLINPHRPAETFVPEAPKPAAAPPPGGKSKVLSALALALATGLFWPPAPAHAEDAGQYVREGLELYTQNKTDEAREKFAKADELAAKDEASPQAAITAYDLACACQRKGDVDKARDLYLKAGLAHDRQLAAAAHFNLGCLLSDAAKKLAGDKPETVPPEKRQELVDKLKEAIANFQHTLDLEPDHAGARKNIELLRLWIKYYADRWHALDREKMRREMNVLQYVEYIVHTQRALRLSVKDLTPQAPLDSFYEHKHAQQELTEEIEPLKDKIKEALTPPAPAKGQPAPPPHSDEQKKQLEQTLKILTGFANAAGIRMTNATDRLSGRDPSAAAKEEKGAETELEKIWLAAVPFKPLLERELRDQTGIVHTLKPDDGATRKPEEKWQGGLFDKLMSSVGKLLLPGTGSAAAPEKQPPAAPGTDTQKNSTAAPAASAAAKPAVATLKDDQCEDLSEFQRETLERTAVLKLKAEMELKQLEAQLAKAPPQAAAQTPPAGTPGGAASGPQGTQPDPEKVKAWYRKAIELAPQAVDKMDSATHALKDKKAGIALPDAEEARKILEEIAKAEPKNEEKKQDQKKDQKQDENKKDEQKDKDDKQSLTQDQLQDILRRVREREKLKHEKDREIRARLGSEQVDKDW